MASINAVLVPAKALKDGKHKVRIAVAHNGDTRYILTDILLDSTKEFKNGVVVKRPDAAYLNTKIRKLLQQYQESLDDIQYLSGLTCSEVVSLLKGATISRHRTIDSVFEEYLKNAIIKESSAKRYRAYWRSTCQFLNKNMPLEHITRATLQSLDKYYRQKGLKPATIRVYLSLFIGIVNYARKNGYVQYRIDPFYGYTLPPREVRDSWLTVDEIRAIRDANIDSASARKARDFFMLSYYLGGINMADLLKINFNENKRVLRYVRTKTELLPKVNKCVEFVIPDEALEIINRYKGADGLLEVTAFMRETKCKVFFGTHFPKIAKAAGLNHLIFYSARKSFSQHAFLLGVNSGVIDYILGHRVDKAGEILYSYVNITPDMATTAVRKVLDNLK